MRRLCLLYKVLHLNNQLLLMTNFHRCGNLPDIQIHLTPSLVEQNASRTRFSRVLSLIGINSIQIFVILTITEYFTNPSENLSDPLKGKLTILMTLLELSY